MINYKKPLLEEAYIIVEPICAGSGIGGSGMPEPTPTCPKTEGQYNANYNCPADCPYYINVPGWSWLNDQCGLNGK